MTPNEELIQRFYTCFQRRDADGMVACYHPDIVFSDPVFQTLKGPRAGAMWHMLAGRSQDLTLVYSAIHADDQQGSAHWEADYTYTTTGRKVHNVIAARFRFQDGQISEHHDTFDLWRWASQALGPTGRLLGWTPFVQRAIRRGAARALAAYIARSASHPGG